MRNLVNVLLVAVLVGLTGQYMGWLAVPVIAVVMSIGTRELHLRAWQVGAGAALAWGIILAFDARSSQFTGLLSAVSGVFKLPAFAFLCVALLLPFALGWSTASVANAVIGRNKP